jgi:hypothetical protein
MAWSLSSDDDDDEELEVLPPCSTAAALASAAAADSDRGPRLSYSGATGNDPVNLLLLSDEDDVEDNGTSSSSHLAPQNRSDPHQTKKKMTNDSSSAIATHAPESKITAPSSSKIKNVFDNNHNNDDDKDDDNDDEDDSSVDSVLALAAKLKPRRKKLVDDDDNDDEPAKKRITTKAHSKATKTAPTKNMTKESSPSPAKKKTKRATAAAKEPKNDPTASSSSPAGNNSKETKTTAKEREVAERKRQRELKKAHDEAEKMAKQRHVRACKQMAGKLAQEEIAILLDDGFGGSNSSKLSWIDRLKSQTGLRQEYLVVDYASALPGTAVVQWIRRNALDGGAPAAVQALHAQQQQHEAAGYEHFAEIAIVVDDALFLSLLERGAYDDDYPKLGEFIKSIEIGWRAAWRKNQDQQPRIILLLDAVLESLEEQWSSQASRKAAAKKHCDFLPTVEELHDALTWVLIEHRVEAILCPNDDILVTHLTKATRMLSERPYISHTSELECVKKIPPHCHPDDVDEVRMRDTFCRQLQQVPRVSNLMALSVVSNYYPTLQSLWADYASSTIHHDNKDGLLAPMFNEKKSFPRLAQQIHTILTSDDPDQIID